MKERSNVLLSGAERDVISFSNSGIEPAPPSKCCNKASVCININFYVCKYVCIFDMYVWVCVVCLFVCMYVYMYICFLCSMYVLYVCMYACMHAC